MFAYGAPPAQAAMSSSAYNDLALEFCAPSDGRIRALAQGAAAGCGTGVCRVDTSGAADAWACRSAIVGAREMDDEGIVRFLAHCAHEGAAVLVHPWDMMGGDRLKRWMSAWTVAMPAETQLGIMAMILGGHLINCRVICGSALLTAVAVSPTCLGDWKMPGTVATLCAGCQSIRQVTTLTAFSVDSAVFDHRALRLLIDNSWGWPHHGRQRRAVPAAWRGPSRRSCPQPARGFPSRPRGYLRDNARAFFGSEKQYPEIHRGQRKCTMLHFLWESSDSCVQTSGRRPFARKRRNYHA